MYGAFFKIFIQGTVGMGGAGHPAVALYGVVAKVRFWVVAPLLLIGVHYMGQQIGHQGVFTVIYAYVYGI